MGEFVKLSAEELKVLHEQNPAMMSYNIEFADVTGGTFGRLTPRVRWLEQRHLMWI